jgi:hypothetical protein
MTMGTNVIYEAEDVSLRPRQGQTDLARYQKVVIAMRSNATRRRCDGFRA